MGNIKKAAGLAGKLARKGLDKADETRKQRNEAAAARQREADFVWGAMYRALLRRFTELVEELDKITKAHNDLYAHFLDDDD